MNNTQKQATIKATPNHARRTFTLRTSNGFKFKTKPLSREQFTTGMHMSSMDWQFFLNHNTNQYTKINN